MILLSKLPDTYRIMALGDSVIAGPGVGLEQTFAKQLERLLKVEASKPAIEVINAGTTDYGTVQELIWLRERGLVYQPDLVIVEVYLNDSRPFETPQGLGVADEELTEIENGLQEMIQLADEHGFKIMLVFFPVDVQVYAEVDIPLGLDRPQQQLIDFALRQGVAYLDLLPILHVNRSADLFFDQVHLKPETHQLVAKALNKAVYEHHLIPPP